MTAEIWIGLGSAVGGILLSLIVTTLYSKLIGLPKKWKEEKDLERKEKEQIINRISCLEEQVSHYPEYRAQSLRIQDELHQADQALEDKENDLLELCRSIKDDVVANRNVVLDRLTRLEEREKNSLRAKILDQFRLFTDPRTNPMAAWSEMEHHSFFHLVKDYENLGGNDYVHEVVLPAMNRLHVIPISDLEAIKELYDSRQLR